MPQTQAQQAALAQARIARAKQTGGEPNQNDLKLVQKVYGKPAPGTKSGKAQRSSPQGSGADLAGRIKQIAEADAAKLRLMEAWAEGLAGDSADWEAVEVVRNMSQVSAAHSKHKGE